MHGHNHANMRDAIACDRGACPVEARWRKDERIIEIRRRRRMRQAQREALLAELHAIADAE